MKIFKQEENIPVVYVQLHDLWHMNNANLEIPDSLYQPLHDYLKENYPKERCINKENRNRFLKVTDQEAISFLRGLDFIIDYEDYQDYTFDMLDRELFHCHKLFTNNLVKTLGPQEVPAHRIEQERIGCTAESLMSLYTFRKQEASNLEPEKVKELLLLNKSKK